MKRRRAMEQNTPSSEKLLKYIQGKASEELKTEIEAWIAEDIKHEKVIMDLAKIYYAHYHSVRIQSRNVNAAYKKVMRILHHKQWTVQLSWQKIAAAAILLIALNVAGWNVIQNRVSTDDYIVLSSNNEKKVEYTLPDGTTVFLNRNSSLRFPLKYAKKSRQVELEGEGYFNVAHNPEHPFIVNTTQGIKVQAIGTKFNVEAFSNDSIVQTTLIEGCVAVTIQRGNDNERYIMHPTDMIRYNTHRDLIIFGKTDYPSKASWLDDVLIFKDTSLPEVVRQLSHNFEADFIITDPRLNDYLFTGTFNNRDLSVILEYMRISSNIQIEIKETSSNRKQIKLSNN